MSTSPNTQILNEATEANSSTAISKNWLNELRTHYDSDPHFQELLKLRELEALRLKEQLSQEPLHAERAARLGERYWRALAASYTPI